MKFQLLIILLTSFLPLIAQVQNFSAQDVLSGTEVSLSDFSSKKGVAVIFTSNVCPYSVYYEGRITQLIADFGTDIQFLLINSHKDSKESIEEMKNKITAWGLSAPYLADKNGKIKASFGARKSPEVYLLKPNGNGYSVFYKGAIDNNPQVASDVKDQYLKRNIENLITGKSAAITNTRPIGCMIK